MTDITPRKWADYEVDALESPFHDEVLIRSSVRLLSRCLPKNTCLTGSENWQYGDLLALEKLTCFMESSLFSLLFFSIYVL